MGPSHIEPQSQPQPHSSRTAARPYTVPPWVHRLVSFHDIDVPEKQLPWWSRTLQSFLAFARELPGEPDAPTAAAAFLEAARTKQPAPQDWQLQQTHRILDAFLAGHENWQWTLDSRTGQRRPSFTLKRAAASRATPPARASQPAPPSAWRVAFANALEAKHFSEAERRTATTAVEHFLQFHRARGLQRLRDLDPTSSVDEFVAHLTHTNAATGEDLRQTRFALQTFFGSIHASRAD